MNNYNMEQLLEKWKQITNCNDLKLSGNEEEMIEYVKNNEQSVACSEHPNCSLTNSPDKGEIIPLNEMAMYMLSNEEANSSKARISSENRGNDFAEAKMRLPNHDANSKEYVHWMPVWRSYLCPRYKVFYVNVRANGKINNKLLYIIGCTQKDGHLTFEFDFDSPPNSASRDEESLSDNFNKLSVEDEDEFFDDSWYDSSDSMS